MKDKIAVFAKKQLISEHAPAISCGFFAETAVKKEDFPEIDTLLNFPQDSLVAPLYEEIIKARLSEVLPRSLWRASNESNEALEDQKQELLLSLPRVWATPCPKAPGNISFLAFFKFRPNAFKFFSEMISQWLIPAAFSKANLKKAAQQDTLIPDFELQSKDDLFRLKDRSGILPSASFAQLNAMMIHAVDFKIRSINGELFTLCEVMIHFDNQEELEQAHANFPALQTEIRLGLQSNFYARRILEIRGLSANAKIGLIQEEIANLISRRPKDFGNDLMNEMQHLLVICRDEFKEIRNCRHLSRIIILKYLFRKSVRAEVKKSPEVRYLRLKIFKALLHSPEKDRSVLAIVAGLNFLTSNEMFEERHLLGAIQNYLPNVRAIEGSFFFNTHGNESVRTFYLEIEKTDGEDFSNDEIRLLRNALPHDLKDRIEHLLHPIFMIRNEEEIMRNILTLSNQVKFLHDLPQVVIIFDEQMEGDLLFTVIMVHLVKGEEKSLEERFKAKKSHFEYIPDRSKVVGYLRKKYPKEANVFRVKFPKKPFIRQNHSVNLNQARQSVAEELTHIIGEIRDFNGGMISRQYERLCTLRDELQEVKYNELLLENFFYSLAPDVMRTALPIKVLKSLFLLLLDAIDKNLFNAEEHSLKITIDSKGVYALLKTKDSAVKESIIETLHKSDISNPELTSSFVQVYEMSYIGFYYQSDEEEKQRLFCQLIENCVSS